MSRTIVLDNEELTSLTHRTRSSAQIRALKYMGIDYRVRPDGTVAVLRTHVEQVFGILPEEKRNEPANEPNWAGI